MAHIDHDHLFKAAAEHNIEPFLGNGIRNLEQIVEEISRDTIMHVYIKSEKKQWPQFAFVFKSITTMKLASTSKFMEQILDICPLLLLQVNAKGDTPLHVAAKFGHPAIVQVLLQQAKAQLEDPERGDWQMLRMTNNEKNTALHEAVIHNNLTVVEILTKEADPDFSYDANKSGETPLYLAAARGSASMVSHILRSCKSAAHEGPNGKTALHAAVMSNNSNVTEQILKKKCSLTKEIDQYGWTPLHYAAYYGLSSIVELLLKYDKSAAYIADNDQKMTPLLMAASQGNINIIKKIIFHCQNCFEQVDDRGWNLLHFVVLSGRRPLLRALLNISSVRSLINEKDNKGNTPCHVCASVYPFLCRRLLSSHGGYSEALNNQNVSVREILRYGPPDELERELEERDNEKGNGQYPLGVISKTPSFIKRRRNYVINEKARENFLIVATLIATVTFTAAFTIPGGYKSEEGRYQGTAILTKNATFQAFIILDGLAMILSLSAVFLFSAGTVPAFKHSRVVALSAHICTSFAMGAMVAAFITGMYAVLAPSSEVTNAICGICLSFILVICFALGCSVR